jgi:hypothetical protein
MSQALTGVIEQAYKSAQVEDTKESKEDKKLRILSKEVDSKKNHD